MTSVLFVNLRAVARKWLGRYVAPGTPNKMGSRIRKKKIPLATHCKQATVGQRSRSDRRLRPKKAIVCPAPGLSPETWTLIA